jgi:hypothetical protein
MNLHIKYYTALLFLFVMSFSASSQDQMRAAKPKPIKKKKQVYEVVNNVVKLNIPGLLIRSFGAQYERKLNRSKSFAMGVIYRPNFKTPILNVLLQDTNFTASAETLFMLKSSRYRSLMLTPEFRFYFKKKTPRGLYLAPFLRYKHEMLSSNFRYQESSNGGIIKTGVYKNRSDAFGAGILFGLQVLTRKKVSIDFWFLGPWAGIQFTKNSSDIPTASLNEFDKAYIESVTEGYNDRFGYDNTYKWTGTGFGNSRSGFTLGLRMFGIHIGYSF